MARPQYKITLNDSHLEKMNLAAFEIEKEGFFIDKMCYFSGWIIGRTENPSRFLSFPQVKSVEEYRKIAEIFI